MRSNPRREFLRHTVDVPLEVERAGGSGDSAGEIERSVNVSYGGLAFQASTCPEVGEVLLIRIRTVEPVFEGRARVAWCRPEPDGFLVGVQFLDSAAAFRSRMVQQVCSIENYRREVRRREGRTLSSQDAAAEWIDRYAGRFPDSRIVYSEDA